MVLPTDLLAATVTGRIVDGATGDPIPATVIIAPDFTVLNDLPGGVDEADKGAIVLGFPTLTIDTAMEHVGTSAIWDYTVNADGSFSANIIGWSDNVNPKSYTYKVTVKNASGTVILGPWSINIQAGTTAPLSASAPVKASSGSSVSIVNIGGGGGVSSWDDLQDKPTVIAAGSTDAEARAAIGAGTSDLTIGITSTTAKAGDAHDSWTDVTGKPLTFPPSAHTTQPSDIVGSTAFGQSLLSMASGSSLRTAIGAGTTGSAIFASEGQADVLTILGLTDAAARLAAAEAAIASATLTVIESAGAYDVPVGNTRPLIFVGADNPGALMDPARDVWLATT